MTRPSEFLLESESCLPLAPILVLFQICLGNNVSYKKHKFNLNTIPWSRGDINPTSHVFAPLNILHEDHRFEQLSLSQHAENGYTSDRSSYLPRHWRHEDMSLTVEHRLSWTRSHAGHHIRYEWKEGCVTHISGSVSQTFSRDPIAYWTSAFLPVSHWPCALRGMNKGECLKSLNGKHKTFQKHQLKFKWASSHF